MKSWQRACVVFFFLVPTLSWSSQDINDHLGVRTRSMGGAGRAIASTNEALYLNPAGMSQYARFDFDMDYAFQLDNPLHVVGLSIVDSTSQPFAGGVDFHLALDPDNGNNSLSYLVAFALSSALIENTLFVGMTGNYDFLPTSIFDLAEVNRFGLDVGVLLRISGGISLAAVGYNLIPTNSRRLPLSVGFGAGLNIGGDMSTTRDLVGAFSGVTLAFDWLLRDLTAATGPENQMSTGLEGLLFSAMPVRFGYKYALQTKEHELSGGLGYVASSFGVEGFFEQNITLTQKRSFGIITRMLF